ncbi:MAG: hypothetical protein CBE50_001910 [Flammeovirgaceae bacterium TMED290]|nr:MAG: hypothetical protein CBE50_001910 [Flammeovirgaceae bacterium TMED290]|tara:strand:- start:4629 stop:5501 length:873 start_codon:yes stop_codon:yes gene_type:complete
MRIFILICFLSSKLFSQEIDYKIYFLDKEIKIGDSIKLVSVIQYPKEIELIQPDSSYQFFPFTFIRKENFQSKLNQELIFDSTLYFLRSFEIDSLQFIKLNSFILKEKDSLEISSNFDTVYFQSLVDNTDQNIKINLSYNNILSILNTYRLTLYTITFILSVLIFYLIFRKKIIIYFRKRRVLKNYNLFKVEFEKLNKQFKLDSNKKNLEKILLEWKRYMENLSLIPYSSMTSKEIIEFTDDMNLIESLRYFDKLIYSNKLIELEKISFINLLESAECKTFDLIKKIENE